LQVASYIPELLSFAWRVINIAPTISGFRGSAANRTEATIFFGMKWRQNYAANGYRPSHLIFGLENQRGGLYLRTSGRRSLHTFDMPNLLLL